MTTNRSRRLVVAGPLLFLAWGVVAIFLLPDLGLGFAVWILVFLVPAAEFYRWLVERERRSNGESFATR
jgi:Flp pilus assembly protein TadB